MTWGVAAGMDHGYDEPPDVDPALCPHGAYIFGGRCLDCDAERLEVLGRPCPNLDLADLDGPW